MKPYRKKYFFAITSLVIICIVLPYLADDILIAASTNGNVKLVQIMLDLRTDPNTRIVDPGNALVQAAYHDRTNVVEVLLQHDVDPNAHVDGGETALMYASRYGSPATVKALLDGGADSRLGDGNSQSPYTYAEGRPKILTLLRQTRRAGHGQN